MKRNAFFLLTLLVLLFCSILYFSSEIVSANEDLTEDFSPLEGSVEDMQMDNLESTTESTNNELEEEEGEEEQFENEMIEAVTLENENVLETLDALPQDTSVSNYNQVDEEVMEDFGEDDEDEAN
ncbi:hypothetical protein ABK040_002811 [Willaertia magna]